MRLSEIRWGTAFGLAILAEVLLIALTVLYMVVYGHVFNPGHPDEFYQSHVRTAAPWISVAAGIPVFVFFGWWLARRGSRQVIVGSAVAFWVLWAIIDNSIMIAAAGFAGIRQVWPFWAASLVTKLLSTWAGVRSRVGPKSS